MSEAVHQKVEAILREQYPLQNLAADTDLLKIIHHLRTRQLELEKENNELRQALAKPEAAQMNDIAEHKRLEQTLRENEARFRLLTEKASDLICLHESDGRYLYLSPSCERLLGYKPEELSGQNPYDLFHPEDINRIQVEAHDKARRGQEISSITYRIRRKSGEYIWFETYTQPVLNHHNQVTRLISASRDVTERWQAELALLEERALLARRVEERTAELSIANAELARTARLKDEFLASMSHELRTPLSGILGMSEALQMEIFGTLNDKQRDFLKDIEAGGRHLLSLINDILDLSKIGAGLLELDLETMSIPGLCQSSLRFVQQQALKKRIKLTSNIDPHVNTLEADERRLKQILVNLLSNAVKFTPPDGEVGLEVAGIGAESAVHFTVWDTGTGISEVDIQRLFQPFVQLDSSLARKHEGTGLGLALVYRLAELHGGSVRVESQVGQGSRFTVSIPWRSTAVLGRITEDLPAPTGISGASTGLPRPLLLLAEDNEANINLIQTILEREGYQVIVARNGLEAVELTKEKRPALILMDIQMPELDGLEAIRRIRADADTAQIPIIALTALAMVGDKERCLEAGANIYLSKPINRPRLLELIEESLKVSKPDLFPLNQR